MVKKALYMLMLVVAMAAFAVQASARAAPTDHHDPAGEGLKDQKNLLNYGGLGGFSGIGDNGLPVGGIGGVVGLGGGLGGLGGGAGGLGGLGGGIGGYGGGGIGGIGVGIGGGALGGIGGIGGGGGFVRFP